VLPAIGAAFPEAANNPVKVLRQMFTWACSATSSLTSFSTTLTDVTAGSRPPRSNGQDTKLSRKLEQLMDAANLAPQWKKLPALNRTVLPKL